MIRGLRDDRSERSNSCQYKRQGKKSCIFNPSGDAKVEEMNMSSKQ